MYSVTENENTIAFAISSELRLVDRVILDSQPFIRQYDVSDDSNFKLALREMLNNAIEHGNKNNINKKVDCVISSLSKNRFKIDVRDEGPGFDYRKLDLALPEDPKQIRNRGISLINAFSDEIEFNEAGNNITVYMTFTDEISFDVQLDNDTAAITPSGNLTAPVADKFRSLLLNLHEQGAVHYRFDLKHVEDIDSICLSVLILLAKTTGKTRNGSRLEIINPTRELIQLFRMTRMDEIYILPAGKS